MSKKFVQNKLPLDNVVYLDGVPGQGCSICGDPHAETRFKVCFDCSEAREIIREALGEGEGSTKGDEILRKLAEKGYLVIDKGFLETAHEMGVPHR